LIEISRSLAKQFRAIARKSILAIDKHGLPPLLVIRGDRTGLRLQAQNAAGAIEYHEAGTQANETFHLPFTALADFDGKKDTTIQLTKNGNSIVASWQEGVVPQNRQYDPPEPQRSLKTPTPPKEMTEQPSTFLKAMQDANDTCAKASEGRYGTTCIQLRGKAGDIIGTDGRQLLRQGGFTFPWKEDVLLPAMSIYGCRELVGQPIALGKTDDHVCLSAGPWKLFIAINKDARFPRVENVIPDTQSATLVHFDDQDSQFLTDNLSSLPGEDNENSPVTIDANGLVVVRARGSSQQPATELALVRSTTRGKTMSFAVNRFLLDRALRLGFKSLYVHADGKPVLYREANRDYVSLPLPKEAVVADDGKATRLRSTDHQPAVEHSEPSESVASRQTSNGKPQAAPTNGHTEPSVDTETNGTSTAKHEANGIAALIDEAEALKELLRDGYTRAHALAIAAKRYRKQARVVNSTLASLRQLQAVEA
jgi:hypothetical protein